MVKKSVTKKDLSRDERIQKEMKRLRRIYADLDEKTKKLAESLISNCAFMTILLEDLQEEIKKNGVVSTYKNGENQYGTKKSPEVEMYNKIIKNLMGITKQLSDLLPKKVEIVEEKEVDAFEEFIKGGM